MRKLIPCADGTSAPGIVICKHLSEGKSSEWIQWHNPEIDAEVCDYLCPRCFARLAAHGSRVIDKLPLLIACMHCVLKLIGSSGTQQFGSKIDSEGNLVRVTLNALESDREQVLRERNQAAFASEPRLADLEKRLLDVGGLIAFLFLPENRVDKLLERGQTFPGHEAQLRRDQEVDCHRNAARLFCSTEGAVRIASGYALSDDDSWRQHSWGVEAETSCVIETTVPWLRYFGFVLDDPESLEFIFGNLSIKEHDVEFMDRFFGAQAVQWMIIRSLKESGMHQEAAKFESDLRAIDHPGSYTG